MKNLILNLSMALVLCFFFSCKDDDNSNPTTESTTECTFEQVDADMDGLIDDDERAIMEECSQDALLVSTDIKENLIGTWNLIGHGEGWVSSISQPCSTITFDNNKLTFTFVDSSVDTTIISDWDIIDGFGGPVLHLEMNSVGIFINSFCSQYMFGDLTPSDGNMHLYEKVE
jgi:hypothetical protein